MEQVTSVTMFCQALTFFCALYSCAAHGRLERNARVEVEENHLWDWNFSNPVVWIPDGGLRGFYGKSVISGRSYAAFQGIPYAQPPIGGLRFKEPQKVTPWGSLRDAIAESRTCIQADFFQMYKVIGDEDCLQINVYTPQVPSAGNKRKLPVMVAFHLGGYFFGKASMQGPGYLLEKDVVLVTMNYRLGAFGFLSTGDEASPGNNGLKDQALALKWVRDNIEHFGGDPNSVTIMGESAGAGSVHLHMVSPLSRGLFHRGISQSGSAFCFWSVNERGVELSYHLGKLLDCPGSGSEDLLTCLREKSAGEIVGVHPLLLEWFTFPVAVWGPVIEPKLKGAFLTELPEDSYKRVGGVAAVPWMTGFNKDELGINVAQILGMPSYLEQFNDNWDKVGPVVLGLEGVTPHPGPTAQYVRQNYMSSANLTLDTRHQAISMMSDRYLIMGGIKAMQYHAKYARSPVYSYQLNYQGKHSHSQLLGLNPEDWGVVHMDDQIYLVNNTAYYPEVKKDDPDYRFLQIFQSLWTNFAIHGVPFISNKTHARVNCWAPNTHRQNHLKFLSLNLNPTMMENPYAGKQVFWNSLQLADGDNVGVSPRVTIEDFAQITSGTSTAWSNFTDVDVEVDLHNLELHDKVDIVDYNHMMEKSPLDAY